jgi:hypothetical protein
LRRISRFCRDSAFRGGFDWVRFAAAAVAPRAAALALASFARLLFAVFGGHTPDVLVALLARRSRAARISSSSSGVVGTVFLQPLEAGHQAEQLVLKASARSGR